MSIGFKNHSESSWGGAGGEVELLIGRGGVPQVEQFVLVGRQAGQLPGSILFNLIFIKRSKCLLLKSLQAAGANGPPCLSGDLVVDFHLLIKTPHKGGRVAY